MSATTTWLSVIALLSLLGCSPALTSGPEMTPQALYGEIRGNPENRLVASSALPSAPPLNAEVTLSGRGGKLLVSNDPEYLATGVALPGALYRDELSGSFRVFYHHANRTGAGLTLATALTNTQAVPVLLFTRGLGQGTNVYPDVAGQGALRGLLGARQRVVYLATLAPGESRVFGSQLAGPGETASALGEYVALAPPPKAGERVSLPALEGALETAPFGRGAPDLPAGFAPAAVTVSVVAYRGAAPRAPQSLPVMPAGPVKPVGGTPYYFLNRGTFPFFDRAARIPLRSAAMLTLNSAVHGTFARPIPGEYRLGIDAVTGRRGFNNGNYGVGYDLRFCVLTGAPSGLPYALLMQPAGGFGHYAYGAEGDILSSPFVSYKNGWWFHRGLAFGPEACLSLRVQLTGGAFGPQKFFFVPFPLFEGV